MRNLKNFIQAVKDPKSWNSMGYFCPKNTFLQLTLYIQRIYLPYFQLLIQQILYIIIPYLFSWNIIYFGQKEPMKVQILRLLSAGSKFTKFLMSFFKAQVSPSSSFSSFFSVITYNLSALLWLKHNILSTKVAHQSGNFQACHCSH